MSREGFVQDHPSGSVRAPPRPYSNRLTGLRPRATLPRRRGPMLTGGGMRRLLVALACAIATACGAAATAHADFPYRPAGGDPLDYSTYHVPAGGVPNDIGEDGNDWKYAATPENPNPSPTDAKELNGV